MSRVRAQRLRRHRWYALHVPARRETAAPRGTEQRRIVEHSEAGDRAERRIDAQPDQEEEGD